MSNSPQTIADLAMALDVNEAFLKIVLFRETVESYYVEFDIAKKSGGLRRISAPSGHVLRLQRRLNAMLLDGHQPRPAAHGFVPGRSIVSNARPHVGKDYLLNIDLEDFFPTIHFGRVLGIFEQGVGFGHPAAVAAAKLACFNEALPIGGATSPILANMVCSKMDGELQTLAKEHGAFYTRYADDMTFSWFDRRGRGALATLDGDGEVHLERALVSTIVSSGFQLNHKKTRLMPRDGPQRVTGLVVNEKVNVDRRRVRQLRAMIHSIERDGLPEAQRRFAESDSRDRFYVGRDIRAHLFGWMAYLHMVRGPGDEVTTRLRRQLENVLAGKRRGEGLAPGSVGFHGAEVDEPPPSNDVAALIAVGESRFVEFKETVRRDLHSGAQTDAGMNSALKAIAGFANTRGGTLLIGVADNGRVAGIEDDILTFKRPSNDAFIGWIDDRIAADLGEHAADRCTVTIEEYANVLVCLVSVGSASRPVFVDDHELYVRRNASSRRLFGDNMWNFLLERFGGSESGS